MKPVLLWVEWEDSILLKNAWCDTDDLTARNGPIVTVGFKVKIEDGYLFLAGSWVSDKESLPWAGMIAIPERAIVRKRRLSRP